MKRVLFLFFTFLGILHVSASEDWSHYEDSQEGFVVQFPHNPNHMLFDEIPLKNSEQVGRLNVYSAPIDEGLLLLGSLYSPLFAGDELEAKNFSELFYSMLIQRMFYDPKAFKNSQIMSQLKTTWDGKPALEFSITYLEKKEPKRVAGLAVIKDHTIYVLFYLATQSKFEEEIQQKFINSFHFTLP